jgi:large subunit ribosomal protein L25
MSETVLIAESGRATGSSASRRLRAEDKIPAVVYGHGMEPLSIAVGRRDLRLAVSGPAGLNTVLDLTVDGTVYPALIKHVDRHPVRRTIQHLDFIQVNLNEEITVSVPVHLVGEAKAVMQNNGLVDPALDQLEVVTTPRNIPDSIVIDVTDMTMDTVIRIEDIELPAGVTATGDPEAPVVTVLVMRKAADDAVDTDDEAAAADGADGDAGASGDDAAADD